MPTTIASSCCHLLPVKRLVGERKLTFGAGILLKTLLARLERIPVCSAALMLACCEVWSWLLFKLTLFDRPQAELADIKSNGIAAHAKYGNFLLVEMEAKGKQGEVPVPVIYHRNGRRFLLPSQAQAVFNITDAQREARGQFFDPTGRLLDHLQKKKLNVQRLNEQGRTFDECHPQEFDNCKNGLSSASTHKPPPPPVATGGETPQVHFLSPPKCVQVFKVTLGRLTLCDYNSACQLAKEGQTLPMEQQEWAATYFQFGAAHTLGTVPYRWEDRQGQKAAAEATLVRATFEVRFANLAMPVIKCTLMLVTGI